MPHTHASRTTNGSVPCHAISADCRAMPAPCITGWVPAVCQQVVWVFCLDVKFWPCIWQAGIQRLGHGVRRVQWNKREQLWARLFCTPSWLNPFETDPACCASLCPRCHSCYNNFGAGKLVKAAADPKQLAITQFAAEVVGRGGRA